MKYLALTLLSGALSVACFLTLIAATAMRGFDELDPRPGLIVLAESGGALFAAGALVSLILFFRSPAWAAMRVPRLPASLRFVFLAQHAVAGVILLLLFPMLAFYVGYGMAISDVDPVRGRAALVILLTAGVLPVLLAWAMRIRRAQKAALWALLAYCLFTGSLFAWYTTQIWHINMETKAPDPLLGRLLVGGCTTIAALGLLSAVAILAQWRKAPSSQ